MAALKKVVILGGGFAGLVTARHLVQRRAVGKLCEVTIIDSQPSHLYTPWLYEVATADLGSQKAMVETRKTVELSFKKLPGFRGVRFIEEEIIGLDEKTKQVKLKGKRQVPFDLLVVALGAEPNYFGVPGLPANALVLKRAADGPRIQAKMRELVIKAREGERQQVVICGAGPNGAEFVGELAHSFQVLEQKGYLQPGGVNIVLVDAGKEMFTILPQPLRSKAVRRFKDLGIEMRPGLRVSEVGKNTLKAFTESGKTEDMVKISFNACIWSAGVKVNTLVESLGLPLNDRGRIVVDLQGLVQGKKYIFAAGDCAAQTNPHTERPDPQSAQVAHYQANYLGENIYRLLKGKSMQNIKLPKMWHFFCALGGEMAAGNFWKTKWWGYPAFVLRRLSDLRYFLKLLPLWFGLKWWWRAVRLYRRNDR